jgi:hypothetical protein
MNNSALGGTASLPFGVEYATLGIDFMLRRSGVFGGVDRRFYAE